MKRYKGTVKNKVVVLEEGVQLPEDTKVEVRVRTPADHKSREEAFRRILDNPITQYVGMDEIIEEDKREREERWDSGGQANS